MKHKGGILSINCQTYLRHSGMEIRIMGMKVDRSIRQIEKLRSTVMRGVSAAQVHANDSWPDIDAVEARRWNTRGLTATIVAVLDRDSELRHDYLLKRWQGVIA